MLKTEVFAVVALAATSAVISATPAQAASLVTVDGTDYEVELVTGTFWELRDQIINTPTWGKSTLSRALASAFASEDSTRFPFFAPGHIREPARSTTVGPSFAIAYWVVASGGIGIYSSRWADDVAQVENFTLYDEFFEDEARGIGLLRREDTYAIASKVEKTKVSSTAVPTPALLPGLLGMGIATLRKRKLASSSQT